MELARQFFDRHFFEREKIAHAGMEVHLLQGQPFKGTEINAACRRIVKNSQRFHVPERRQIRNESAGIEAQDLKGTIPYGLQTLDAGMRYAEILERKFFEAFQ